MTVLPKSNEITKSEEQDREREEPNTGFPFAKLKTLIIDFTILTEEMKQLPQKYRPEEHWYVLGSILEIIVSHKLYRAGGYSSVDDYCNRNLLYKRQHVYKLIQTVKFINKQETQAKTAAERSNIKRLFALGFTKLHLLQQTSPEKLTKLCLEGITYRSSNGSQQRLDLETLTVAQLRQFLDEDSTPIKTSSTPQEQKASLPYKQVSAINREAQTLAQYIKQCANKLDNREALESLMSTITELSQTVAQGISEMIDNEENLAVGVEASKEQPQKKRSEILVAQVKQDRAKIQKLVAQIKQQSQISNTLQQQAEMIIKRSLELATEMRHIRSKVFPH